jgi:hypothetical protein
MPIRSFRGKLDDGSITKIRLSTPKGMVGYRIKKFDIIGSEPGAADYEAVVKVYKTPQTVATATIDFDDPLLLACATYQGNNAAFNYPTTKWVIFDNEVFNQDVYLTSQDLQNNTMNFYLELELLKLDKNSQAVATLKDIRSNTL